MRVMYNEKKATKKVVQHKTELDKYLADDCEDDNDKIFDILNWWKTNSTKYVVLSMIARDVLAMPISTVASELAFSTGGRRARELFLEMKGSGINPDTVSYHTLIHGLCCVGDWEKGRSLFIEMMDQGVPPSVRTFNVLIDECCKKRKLDEANRLLELMIQRGVDPNISVAIKLLEEMAKGNEESSDICKPNVVPYNTIIDGLCKAALVKKARELYLEMKGSGISPSAVTYNILINMLCKNGQLEKANELLSHMEEKGCAPNVFTFNTLMFGILKNNEIPKVVELLHKMAETNRAAERLYLCYRTKTAVDMTTLLSRERCSAITHAVVVTMIHEDLFDMGFQTVSGIYEVAWSKIGLGSKSV
ncbi:putative pentatricopeptide repeat-containing protein At1g12700, mitochondrial [Pistacia vera]|uniref:putative pentatricopeptide repeat-containing protein At1g12700, mitochondrial n=1 Tax=Pistacia vera TaxID=55513 RepID=UPI001263B345|nr:putative pentatricopeptide repeat-containing protein At1g12700, mitochondrial [Pistacia vera]